jgi:hypothetical protein
MTSSTTIPLHLLTLFETMDFISSAKKDCKPCFNTRQYVDRNSYLGAFIRWINGEKQSTYGNNIIRHCCESASQAYSSYIGTDYEPIILNKMIELRKGLIEIQSTYSKDTKEIDTVNHINNSIMILDLKIPLSEKIKNGIIAGNFITPNSISSSTNQISNSVTEHNSIIDTTTETKSTKSKK